MAGHGTVLLIHPPFYRLFSDSFSYNRYPVSLGYLAGSAVVGTDWDVHVYNADFNPRNTGGSGDVTFAFRSGSGFANYVRTLGDPSSPIWDEVRSTIERFKPAVVGITCMTPNFASVSQVAQIAKSIDSATTVVVGGPHPTIVGRDAMTDHAFDVAVRGEGEVTIVELLNTLARHDDLGTVRGLMFRDHGNLVETAPREYMPDLGNLIIPHEYAADVLVDFPSYPRNSFDRVFANRGCPFDCSFCASRYVWGRRVRFRPIDHLLREITGLTSKGINTLYFCDDTFGVNREWLVKLCHALIDACPGLRWSCEIHARLIDDDTLSLMKRAGCYQIELGIESGNNEILRRIRKQITIEQGLAAAQKVTNHGIELAAYFLIGFPFETEENLQDTYRAIRQLRNRATVTLSIFTPFPGTELYEFCVENGLIDQDYDISMHNLQSLDAFTLHVEPERFLAIASEIERFVDRSNRAYRMRRILSSNTFWRVKELGVRESVVKLKKALVSQK
jgi:radical SAM superfamily enzyme YgiQ (UPF0313 family)